MLERFNGAHKIKELIKEKSFPNEQDNNNRLLLIFGLIYVGFIVM